MVEINRRNSTERSPKKENRSRSLFHISGDGFENFANLAAIRQYSRYKYGDIDALAVYADLFSKKLIDDISLSGTFIVTPPYSTLMSSVIPLAESVAQKIGIPHVELRTKGSSDKFLTYASLKTQEERGTAKNSAKVVMKESEKHTATKAILFDDMETTGSTFDQMEKAMNKYSIPVVGAYTVAILDTTDPAREEWVNTFTLNYEREILVRILNSPNTLVNRHTLKSIINLPDIIRFALMKNLAPQTIDKLHKAMEVYFDNQ